MEDNAALRNIVRRDLGEGYRPGRGQHVLRKPYGKEKRAPEREARFFGS